MSRSPSRFQVKPAVAKILAAALAAALVASASLVSAQDAGYYPGTSQDQNAPSQDQSADPPDRVARLAYLSGDVEFAPAGESDWGTADVNRPLVTGDRLLTGNGGRAALELGDAALRIDDGSAFDFLELDDTTTQVELSQGTLNLRVRRLGDGQTYEIDTPTVAFVAGQPGMYRVDVAPDGNGAMVTVFEGAGTIYGENGASRELRAGQSYRFDNSSLANVAVNGLPQADAFDRFCQTRDSRYGNSVSRRYVSEDVVGYDDLDDNGDWQDTPDYGEVWYPAHVAADWAPYRDGHWAWIDPWGWTWVDDESWGYAPFHYGRWAYVRNRWGWVPGPRVARAVYAPALVAFVGGSGLALSIRVGGGEPVGWFPLGPRDVYVPPYRASRGYFDNVNISNIRTVFVNKTVINNYYGGYAANRPFAGRVDYAYRNNPRAFTAVPRNVFTDARPVRPAVLRVNVGALGKASIAAMPHVAPTRASLAIRPPHRPIAAPVAKAFDRSVVARHAPPPRPVPFAAREKLIIRQGGAPLPVAQLHQLRQQRAKQQPQTQRVRVVGATPKAGLPHAPGKPVEPPPRQVVPPHMANGIHPIPARHPAAPSNAVGAQPLRPGEMRSTRFAHPQTGAAGTGSNEAATRKQEQASRLKQQNVQAQQHIEQMAQQRQASERAAQLHAQQAKQQHDAQMAQQRQASERAAQLHAQQAQQQHDAQMAQQRQASERAAQLHAQQAQQQHDAQMAQQRQAQAAAHTVQVQHSQQQARQQAQQKAEQAREKKRKDQHDQQDNGGH